jgi:NADH-quinone oxidoreductase E subunit
MSFVFNDVAMKEFEIWKKKFPDNPDGRRSLVIPALRLAQRQAGWISMNVVEYVAEITGTEPLHVWGVATFYTMFNKEPVGRYLLQFCTNISCGLLGGEELVSHACRKLGIDKEMTTPDGMFTIKEVECLGACGNAPVVQVNDKYYENMTIEKLDSLINGFSDSGNGD